MHDMLLRDRPEQRATLTVLPAALPARQAYAKWGWRTVAQKCNPLPGSPVFDVLALSVLESSLRRLELPGRREGIVAMSNRDRAGRVLEILALPGLAGGNDRARTAGRQAGENEPF